MRTALPDQSGLVNEGSTNATSQDEDALVQLIFTAPSLNIRKSVVSTDGIGVLNPDPVGPDGITWDGGSSPRWNGVINSLNYIASTIDSNLEGADAGDLVTFAIVLENTGSGVGGAHDIIVRDTPPANYEYPTPGDGNSIAIQVFNGDGTTSIAYTQSDGSSITDQAAALFGTGIQLTDPMPMARHRHTMKQTAKISSLLPTRCAWLPSLSPVKATRILLT